MKKTRSLSSNAVGLKHGFRSGLENEIACTLERQGVDYQFESLKLPYVVPASNHVYTPDFLLPNGIIIESKGRFLPEDRKKMVLVKKQHPELDIRLVFQRVNSPLYKGSKTTYGTWATKSGFKFAEKKIPMEWIEEGGSLEHVERFIRY
jgi:hypothetical protein